MMKVPLNLVRRRIANICVGPSTLRGQPPKTIEISRNFFKEFNLSMFEKVNSENEFLEILDQQTKSLQAKIPSKSWGMARKALNLFLFQATHDIYLCETYNLRKLIPFFEVVLDNPNAKKLLLFAKEKNRKLDWINIRDHNPELNNKLQEFAKDIAKEKYNCERCYLDLYFWRSEE